MPLFILFMSILPLSLDLLFVIALMNQSVPIARNTELELPNCTIIFCIYNFIVLMVNHEG